MGSYERMHERATLPLGLGLRVGTWILTWQRFHRIEIRRSVPRKEQVNVKIGIPGQITTCTCSKVHVVLSFMREVDSIGEVSIQTQYIL